MLDKATDSVFCVANDVSKTVQRQCQELEKNIRKSYNLKETCEHHV